MTTINKKNQLDQEYNKYEKQLKSDIKLIPDFKKRIRELVDETTIMKLSIGKFTTKELEQYHAKLDEIDSLRKKIKNIEDDTSVMKYYIKNGEILSKYYDNLENCPPSTAMSSSNISYKNTLSSSMGMGACQGNVSISNYIEQSESINRNDLLNEYLINNDPHYIQTNVTNPLNNTKEDYCSQCNSYRVVLSAESLYVCPNCGEQIDTIVEYDRPSYKDPQQENVHFEYQRLNHFKDHLARIQAKESTQIPEIVFDIILVEFSKTGRTNLADLTEPMVKSYLKKYIKLGLNKYYENVHKIIYKLTGIAPILFPIEVEQQLCNMFMKIEEPFENNRPKERRNLISYPYVLYKLCQLLGYTEYLKYFNLLKSTDKLFEQDKTWKKICAINGWDFYPSTRS